MADKRDSQPTIGMRRSANAPAQAAEEKQAPADQEVEASQDPAADGKAGSHNSDSKVTQDLEEAGLDAKPLEAFTGGPESLTGTVLTERYAVGKQLGSGGMGAVYVAQHVDLKKQVALKVLHSEFGAKTELVQRFLQEAQAASRIRHENVIDITDFGKTPSGLAFFVMEYLEGSDLAEALGKGPFPWIRTEWIFMQVCDALRAAHAKGIVHRDLKPANIFLLDRGGPDYVKLLDFGIAKLTDVREPGEKLTRTGTLFGTPQYMAPEQAAGREVDTRTDIYAMGCILFEMVTGRVPYEGDNFMHTLYMHLNEDLPDLTEAIESCGAPTAINAIVHRALAKAPDERFQTVEELLDTIMAVSKSDPPPVLRSGRAITAPYDFSDEESGEQAERPTKPSDQHTKVDAPIKPTEIGIAGFAREGLSALEQAATGTVEVQSPAITPAPADAPQKARPMWHWAAGGLVVAAAAFLVLRSSDSEKAKPAVAPIAEPAPVETSVPVAVEQPLPTTQEVLVDTRPSGATIIHNDETFATPATLMIPAGETWRIRIEKPGFKTVSMYTVLGQPKILVELAAAPVVAPPVAPPIATKPRRPSSGKNTKSTRTKTTPTADPVKPAKPKDDAKRPNTDNPDPWDD